LAHLLCSCLFGLAALIVVNGLATFQSSAQTLPPSIRFWDVQFFTPDNGWLFCSEGLLHTIDGGRTWVREQPAGGSSQTSDTVVQMQFLDASHGWILYDDSRLYRTSNGGQTWQEILVKPPAWDRPGGLTYVTDLDQFHMVSPQIGFGLDGDGIQLLRTTDGGVTWRTSLITPQRLAFRSLFFVDSQHGWVVGLGGRLYHTTNGSQTWSPLLPPPARGPLGMQFLTTNLGFVLETDARRAVFRTSDGGQSWQQCAPSQTVPDAWKFRFRSPTLGWAAATNGIVLRTTDGCANWQIIQTPATAQLRDIHFVTDTLGWAVGDEGTVLKSADGGLTWTPVQVNVP
jgi:photosystem II stability/assembly factor-like uncharacterized protein